MRIRTTPLWVGAIAAIAVAGCGSSSNSTSGATALTKAEFLKQGNAICKKGNQQINAAANKLFGGKKPSSAEETKFGQSTAIPSVQSQISGVEALSAPSGDESTVKAITDAAQKALDKAKANQSLLNASNTAGPFAEADKLAKAYGLTACAGGG